MVEFVVVLLVYYLCLMLVGGGVLIFYEGWLVGGIGIFGGSVF